jgi:hypothetical protein
MGINNFRSKIANTVGAKLRENSGSYKLLIRMEVQGKKPSFYVTVIHMCNVKKFAVPVVFVDVMKSSLKALFTLVWSFCSCN